MKPIFFLLFCTWSLIMTGCWQKQLNYEQIASFQDNTLPEPDMVITDSTRVLVIVPHADDETIAGGLISHFKSNGAKVHLLTLCEHNEIRREELACSAAILGIDSVEVAGFVNNSWEAIMNNEIVFWYDHTDSIQSVIQSKIRDFHPDYLITYDAEIGGYGHPEHRISAQLTETIFNKLKKQPGYAPKMIFQITLTNDLEKFLVSGSPGYELTKKLNDSKGLPPPDVALDIKDYWDEKNQAALCHQSQIKTLRRFHIVYQEEHKEEHISSFNKEYYRVIQ